MRQLASDAGRTRRREAGRSDEEETRKKDGRGGKSGEEVGVIQSWGVVGGSGGKTTGKGENRKRFALVLLDVALAAGLGGELPEPGLRRLNHPWVAASGATTTPRAA